MVMITIQNASCFTDGGTIPHISGEIEVDIDNFKTGEIIYLKFEQEGETDFYKFISISKQEREGHTKFCIIKKSENYISVLMDPQEDIKLYPLHMLQLSYSLSNYLTKDEIAQAFDNMEIPTLEKSFIDDEWDIFPAVRYIRVLSRLSTLSLLRDRMEHDKPELSLHNLAVSQLVMYLLFTCCDLLGQPYGRVDIAGWLQSKRSEKMNKEKEEATNLVTTGMLTHEIALCYVSTYNKYYGVLSSLYNFFNNKCPRDLISQLIDKLKVSIYDPTGNYCRDLSQEEKIKFLINNRHAFTHNLKFNLRDGSGRHEEIMGTHCGSITLKNGERWEIILEREFIDILIQCIVVTMANEIKSYIQ
jgi:hypothetical protein